MWSDAARAGAMQARGFSGGGATGGSASIGPAGDVSGGSAGIQSRLAQAGATSRGRWNGGKGPAHQAGVNAITPNMRAPIPLTPSPLTNVASSYKYV